MLPGFDSAAGAIVAACVNDPAAVRPTLALAQRLWDDPVELLTTAESGHRLERHGLLERPVRDTTVDWRGALVTPALVVRTLLFPSADPPAQLRGLARPGGERIAAHGPAQLEIVPVIGPRGADHAAAAADMCAAAGRAVDVFAGGIESLGTPGLLEALACTCWLRGVDLFLDLDAAAAALAARPLRLPSAALGLRLLLAVEGRGGPAAVPPGLLAPAVHVAPLSYEARLELWRQELDPEVVGDVARRFRFEAGAIRSVARRVRRDGAVSRERLVTACREELELDLGELAEEVRPRFRRDELVLPRKQSLQLDEIRLAMASLAEVHHEWGTGRVWHDAGLAVLFAGCARHRQDDGGRGARRRAPACRCTASTCRRWSTSTSARRRRTSGACSTPARRATSSCCSTKPTRCSAAARRSRDAHDRYANLEVSYLLSRMERAKGVTILATNRKDDLDGAFLRRLRYVVDFPLPDVTERRGIWTVAIPEGVDGSALDLDFLADRFPLTGGHIRSAIFNACLQSAAGGGEPRLSMEAVLIAVRRELDKADRAVSLERFGEYAALVQERAS